jgi:hypothetical protein
MRISDARRGAALAAAALALAACEPAGIAGNPTRATVSVAGNAIGVAGPSGFCVDGASTDVNSAGAFLLMADCRLLGGAGGGGRTAGAALTASISAGGLGGEGDDPLQSLQDLQDFVGTAEGLALVGRSGSSRGVRIVSSLQQGDVLYLLVEDAGPQPIAGIEPRFWRAFLDLDGHLAVLSVLGFEGAGAGSQQGLDLLAAFVAAMKAANAA